MTVGGRQGGGAQVAHTVLAEVAWELEPVARSAGTARRLLRSLLDTPDRAAWAEAAELAVSEVVTNAVLHAHTAVGLSARLQEDGLLVAVRDRNPALPRRRHYDADATTGRGMSLLAEVTRASGVESLGADGKVVWFLVGDPPEPADAEALLAAWSDDAVDDPHAADVPAAHGAPAPPDPSGPLRPVALLGLPVALWRAAKEHHDAALRELVLLAAAHPEAVRDLDDPALLDAARAFMAAAVPAAANAAAAHAAAAHTAAERLPQQRSAAQPVAGTCDLHLDMRPGLGRAFAALVHTLDEVERLARAGRLLVRPAPPEVVAVRDWACGEVVAQLGGAAPRPWTGPLAPVPDARLPVTLRCAE